MIGRRAQMRCMRTAMAAMLATASIALAETDQPRGFASPDAAATALILAAKTGDLDEMQAILGPGSARLTDSGDAVADAKAREEFVAAYEKAHHFEEVGAGEVRLDVGTDAWPFPIPLVQRDGQWSFDTPAGEEELVNRRIGRNELAAIEVCRAFADAQREYYAWNPNGDDLHHYARQLASSAGEKNGLYWPTQAGERPSPMGVMVARARLEGYQAGKGGSVKRIPYHGYVYKVLTGQGPSAPGGAYDYLVRDQLLGGFALVASPARWDASAVMTFMINHDGVLYEKDLGPDTEQIVEKMTEFDPGEGWKKVTAETEADAEKEEPEAAAAG